MCMATGPGTDMFDSTRIIGQNIYLKAKVSDISLCECTWVLLCMLIQALFLPLFL